MNRKITFIKALVLSVFIFSTPIIVNAQSNCRWAKGYGGTFEDDGNSMTVDPNGNIYTTGTFFSPTIKFGSTTLTNAAQGFGDVFIVKQDSCGNIKWAQRAGGTSDDQGMAIAADGFGNVFVTGIYNSTSITFGTHVLNNPGGLNIFLVKYNHSGIVDWAKTTSGNGQSVSTGLTVDQHGNVFMAGYFSDTVNFNTTQILNLGGSGSDNIFVAKYDSTGVVSWVSRAGYTSTDETTGIAADASGNVYVTGYFEDSISFGPTKYMATSGYNNIFLAKYNSTTGSVVWAKSAGKSGDNHGNGVAIDNLGNPSVAGYFQSDTLTFGTVKIVNNTFGGGGGNGFVVKYNSSGTALWANTLGADWNDVATAIAADASGNVYVGGFFQSAILTLGPFPLTNFSNADSSSDIFLAKYDKNGAINWAKSASGNYNDFLNSVVVTPSGSPVIFGQYNSTSLVFGNNTITNTGDYDLFITNDITQNNMITPQICEVTVDSLSQHNVIYWDKTINPEAKSFVILRETSANSYQPIAVIPRDSLSLFTDTVQAKYFPNTGNPNAGTYRYKIQVIDTSGNYSLMSPYHNTIYIIDNGSGTFSWNGYIIEPATNPVSIYNLMRDNTGTGKFIIAQNIAGTQFTITDPKYSSFPNGRWYVETQWSIGCTATYRLLQSTTVNTSRSNIKNNSATVGIKNQDASALISVYPNPAGNNLTVECPDWITDQTTFVVVENYLGMEVMKFVPAKSQSKILLDMSNLASGIYCIEVRGTNFTAIKKIVVNH